MEGIKAVLKRLYPLFLQKFPLCQLNTPVCTKIATVIHHSEGRIGTKVTEEKTWMASCVGCNNWVEGNDSDARQMGLKKQQHGIYKRIK